MAKFRKKPVVIDAARWQEDGEMPDWLLAAIKSGTVVMGGEPTSYPHAEIITLEGVMRADVGDWIIRGVKNELYPCKPDIFAALYDEVA